MDRMKNCKSVLVLFFTSLLNVTLACQVHLCYTEYTNLASGYSRLPRTSILRSLNSHQTAVKEYCQSLEAYSACMKGLGKSCRGKLDYHAVIAHVKKWIDDYNCTGTQKIRNPSKTSVNLTLRQQSEASSHDYPWTGSSSISNPPPTKRKRKRCKKHCSHPQHRNFQDSSSSSSSQEASSSFSSSTTSHFIHLTVPYYALTSVLITTLISAIAFT